MRHFSSPSLSKTSFAQYRKFSKGIYTRSLRAAEHLEGLTILHINSATGGGVAELLKNQVPLERSLGLNSQWLVLNENKDFFFITKKMFNLIQGQKGFLPAPEREYFLQHLRQPGLSLEKILGRIKGPAVVVLHDVQVLPLIDYVPARFKAIVRLHMDLMSPNTEVMKFLLPFLKKAGKVVVTHKQFIPKGLKRKQILLSFPAINPFSKKNEAMPKDVAGRLLKKIHVDILRPIIAQVSRFDVWKDPEGVIEAYYLAKKQVPGLQLILEGAAEAKDDPEAAAIYQKLKMEHKNDPDLFLQGQRTLRGPKYEKWVNAIQSRADIILQKSLREGFGLTVTEALYKGKPVIGGNALGIKLQIKNKWNGFIVNSPKECAKRIIQLLKDKNLGSRLGKNGQAFVKENFLINRLVLDFLKVYLEFIKS